MKKLDGRIIKLKQQLGNRYEPNQIIKEMAQDFCVTPLYLNQLFKKQTGKTILQYDRDVRLEKAKYLLETTYKQIKEICYEVGFYNYEHFLREFKKKFGNSPKEIQKQSWLDRANGESEKNKS